jgi:adenosylcobinamide-phosphate synthase
VIDTVIGYIPSRIAALLIVIAALFTPKAKPLQAFKLVITQGSWHARSNEGWPMAAMSGALNIALPTESQPTDSQPTDPQANAWFSAQNASARLDHADLKRALWLHSVTLCLTILILSALVLLSLST